MFLKGRVVEKAKNRAIPHWLPLLIILGAFAVSQIIFMYDLSSYTTLNTDALHHLTAMKEIFRNNNHGFLLTDINPTFTLATYLPIFHYIFGLPIAIAKLSGSIISYTVIEKTFISDESFPDRYFNVLRKVENIMILPTPLSTSCLIIFFMQPNLVSFFNSLPSLKRVCIDALEGFPSWNEPK